MILAADERATDSGLKGQGWQVRRWVLTDGRYEGYGRWTRGSRTMDTRATDGNEEGKDGRGLKGSEDGRLGFEGWT